MGKNKGEKQDAEQQDVDQAVEAQVSPGPSTVRLTNLTRGQLVFNLPHAEYCGDSCACVAIVRREEHYDYRNEEHVVKMVDRLVCSSASWLAGETKEVDMRVLNVSQIRLAVLSKELATAS